MRINRCEKICLLLLCFGFSGKVIRADSLASGWDVSLDCPPVGSVFSTGAFETANIAGFQASGLCARTTSRYTRLEFESSSGGTLLSSLVYAVHTGDVLITPPLLATEYEPNYSVNAGCPLGNRSLRFIVAGWGPGETTIENELVFGTASYSSSGGIAVNNLYDVHGALLSSVPISIPGSCSDGLYTATGSGDRGGTVFLTEGAGGVFKTQADHNIFFLPDYTVNQVADFGSISAPAMVFDSQGASNTRQARATSDGSGTFIWLRPFSDIEGGVVNMAANYDLLSITSVNAPENGIVLGEVTRLTGGGVVLGTGEVACIVYRGVSLRMICSGENPEDNAFPYSFVFTVEGSQVLGQHTAYSSNQELIYSGNNDVVSDGNRLIVVDLGKLRVLIYNDIPSSSLQYPDVVLGQESLTGYHALDPSDSVFGGPTAAATNGTKFAVADAHAHRVLLWNSFPNRDSQPADLVLGQADFASSGVNHGAGSFFPDSQGFYGPSGIAIVGNKLLVADSQNNRVLIWNSWPSVNQQAADVVVGQNDMTSNDQNVTGGAARADGLSAPLWVTSDGTRMLVSDNNNNRVVIYNSIPTANLASANVVVGQPDMSTSSGGLTQTKLQSPGKAWIDGTSLYIADTNNSRVIVHDTIPTSNGALASRVLGQLNFTSSDYGATPALDTTYYPTAVGSGGGKIYVSDALHSRVSVWNAPPTTNTQAGSYVLGQYNADSAGGVGFHSEGFLQVPTMSWSNGQQFFVADPGTHRVLMWNATPTENKQMPDVILGQTTIHGSASGTGPASFFDPNGVAATSTKVYVVDSFNNRVLGWNSIPTANGQDADFVLGQPDFTSTDPNYGATSAQTMNYPTSLAVDSSHLIVADGQRVLIWNHHPATTQEPADVVVGQMDMAGEDPILPPTASSVWSPYAVSTNGTHLVVADYENNRVLIWNSIPVTNGQPADVVVGQTDFSSQTPNAGGVSASSLSLPTGVFLSGSKLYISDNGNGRVLFFESIPTANHASADAVFGQPNFTSAEVNYGGMSDRSVFTPSALFRLGNVLYICDWFAQRVLGIEVQ